MYANIIVDISHEQLDRTFQYRVPKAMEEAVAVGSQVAIPFGKGNRTITGYVIELTETAEFDENRMKEILSVEEQAVAVESQMIRLAAWIRRQYGSTMIQALKTVMPVKDKVKQVEKIFYHWNVSREEAEAAVCEAKRKHYKARARFLEALLEEGVLSKEEAAKRFQISLATIRPLLEKKVIREEREISYRGGARAYGADGTGVILNEEQRRIADDICRHYDAGDFQPCLIHGITGSGKTEVYMEIMDHVIAGGKSVIVLIPEIALTYQTVMRFYKRFGNRVSLVNSRLSAGEKYDQFMRAKRGEIDIMIGPRSALFTPFSNLGLIVIDEEHESAYKSEYMPRYHARETAIERMRICGGMVILGSATPSMESYFRAKTGEYRLYRMTKRASSGSQLSSVHVVDLREELKAGNKSIFSRTLSEMIRGRLQKKEQIMLFLNRRGYAGFVSCRQCGKAIGCPHCDVSLTAHRNGMLVCHYCGYQIPMPKTCPSCHSPYIAGFGLGTQKVESMAAAAFPGARILRMDMDTTSKKGSHEDILTRFASGEADILVGTQMIVKGHDFKNVTLVGILAADMSLYAGDYRSSEKTFQLLTQAAGRAGRGQKQGDVVIQTYTPEHYSIEAAKNQDYEGFYEREIMYRRMLGYPPAGFLLQLLLTSQSEEKAENLINQYAALIQRRYNGMIDTIGPTDAPVSKMKDSYRKLLYMKSRKMEWLIQAKDDIESAFQDASPGRSAAIQFDFN